MYKLTNYSNIIQHIGRGVFIPKSSKCWLEYQDWLDLGNIPEPFMSDDEIATASAENLRQLEHQTERADLEKKTIEVKENWVRDRLQETTLDIPTKVALGKIFKKLIAFID